MKEKRKSNETSDSEDDIWEYKSVKRVRKKPDSDEVSISSNIAQTKMTIKPRGKSSLTQNTAEDTDSNTIAFKTTSKNKRNKAASKAGTSTDVNGKDVKTKSSRKRLSVSSMQSGGSSPSQQLQQTLHNHNNSKGATSASTSKQSGRLSAKTSSQRSGQTSSRGGKGGTGRKSSTKKKVSQQTPQSKIPEVTAGFVSTIYNIHVHLLGLQNIYYRKTCLLRFRSIL